MAAYAIAWVFEGGQAPRRTAAIVAVAGARVTQGETH